MNKHELLSRYISVTYKEVEEEEGRGGRGGSHLQVFHSSTAGYWCIDLVCGSQCMLTMDIHSRKHT